MDSEKKRDFLEKRRRKRTSCTKRWRVRQIRQLLGLLLCVSILAPDVAPLVSYAKDGIENRLHFVDFSRPEALIWDDLGIASASDADQREDLPDRDAGDVIFFEEELEEIDGRIHLATDSNAQVREPEFFYEANMEEEPEGILVDFSETSRTYLIQKEIGTDENGEPINEYLTIVGESPNLYKDEDGVVRSYDNTLVPVRGKMRVKSVEVASDSDASSSNARKRRSVRTVGTDYENAQGKWTVRLPEEMDAQNGYVLSSGEESLEIIPTEGNFTSSMALDNAIRYTDVFENVDFQYTVLGATIKEDIILLKLQKKNIFSYRLKSDGLKYKKVGNTVVVYKNSYRKPLFCLSAPMMVDSDGAYSSDIQVQFDSKTKIVTFEADANWLADKERSYPVRIDPGATLIETSAFSVNMVAKGDTEELAGTGREDNSIYNRHFGDNGHTMVGYSREYGHCRAVIGISTDWESLIHHSATQVDGPGVKSVQFSVGVQTNDTPNRSPFILKAFQESWDASSVSYASVCNLKAEQIGNEAYSSGESTDGNRRLTFDITSVYYDWVKGTKPRNGLMLQVQAENSFEPDNLQSVFWAETIFNKSGMQNGPRIEVAWQGSLEGVDLTTLPMSEFSLDVGAGVVESEAGGKSTKGVLAHGASQAGSDIEYAFYEKNTDTQVTSGTVVAHEDVDCPDYTQVDGDALWEARQDSNWQSDPALCGGELETDTIYYAKAKGYGYEITEDPETGEPQQSEEPDESEELTSDTFLLYEVQATDVVPRIARHYGISVEQLKSDNRFEDQLTVAGDVLFIRNPKTDRPYTPKMSKTDVEWLLTYCLEQGFDPKDFFDMEPINMANGSFYMQEVDAEIADLGDDFSIERSYNSIAPFFRSEFGMGWSSLVGEKLMVLEDGRIIYVRADGKGLIFEKDGDHYQAPDGYAYELECVDEVQADPDEEEETDAASDGWRISQPDGTEKVFNANGLLVEKTNRRGLTTSYIYDEAFALERVISPSGNVYEITQTPEGLITEIAIPDGNVIQYTYNEDDELICVTNPGGGTRRYEYDDDHRMTAWYDENDTKVVTNAYEAGRVVSQTDALGNQAELSYTENATILSDNRGNVTRYEKDSDNRVIQIAYANGESEYTAYTEDGYIAAKTDANGTTTRYTYDTDGNVLSETRADGSSRHFTYDSYAQMLTETDFEGHTTHYTYDEKGNLLSITDGAGNTTRYVYDELSRITQMTDANGNTDYFAYEGEAAPIRSYTDAQGNITTYEYDEMNRLLTETDPMGGVTIHTYDENGWEISLEEPDGAQTTYTFSPAGEILSMTDAMGEETTFTYDAMYHVLSGEDALGNTVTYEYDENYNKIAETDAKGNVTKHAYDVRDRKIASTDALGNTVMYVLDGNGNTVKTIDRRGNHSRVQYSKTLGLPTRVVDELGNVTQYTYDRNGNVTKVLYPDGSSLHYAYDGAGRVCETTAQNGLVTQLTYDGNGNIIRLADDESREYSFQYDEKNRLVQAQDPLGGITSYTYDALGNQTQVTDDREHTTEYAYDAVGRLTQITDALGAVCVYEYDPLGRVLAFTDQNQNQKSWVYDAIGQKRVEEDADQNLTAYEYDSLGNLTKQTDALKGETSMTFDALNRMQTMTDALGGMYQYTYDENGNVTAITMPDGDMVRMEYDAAGNMTRYQDEAGLITTYEYDSMGRTVKVSDNAGNRTESAYDVSGNLTRQTDAIGRTTHFTYDRFGRLTSVIAPGNATTQYAYDALDRLTAVTEADQTTTTYEYDAVGNLTKTTKPGEAITAYCYDAGNRLTASVNPLGAERAFFYDAKGNLTKTVDANGNTKSYTYDVLDRLQNFTDAREGVTRYEYDELSRLLAQTTPEGNRTEYRYDALNRMIREKDPNGFITRYEYDSMGNLLQVISPKGARTTYTYDPHDEVTSVTDAAGNTTTYTVNLNRQVTELTQKNGGIYHYTYDAVNRLTGMETPLGLRRTFTYDDADNLIQDTDQLGRTTTYEYDVMHRMTASTNATGAVTRYGYDIRGNQNQVVNAVGAIWTYEYDLADQLKNSIDPEGKVTKAVYDLVGNLTSVTKPGGRTTKYEYDANYNVTTVRDPKRYSYINSYDADNRLTQSYDPLEQMETVVYDAGSRIRELQDKMGLTQSFTYDAHSNVLTSKATNGLVTRFTYDVLDQLTSVTDPMGQVTRYTYDEMGNIRTVTNPRNKTTTYTYNLENNLTSLTSPMGRTETYTYDVAGRMTERMTPAGHRIYYDYTKLNELAEKTYERADEQTEDHPVQMGYNAMGERIQMQDLTGESTYTYDLLGRLKTATNGSGKTVTYEYDVADQLGAIQYPDGKRVTYQYDKNDNLTTLVDRDGRKHIFTYDALNRLIQVVRSDGSESHYIYNARNQVLEVKNTCSCGFLISDYQYTYDAAGWIVQEIAKECLYTSKKDYGHMGGSKDSCAHKTTNYWQNQNPTWETVTRTFSYDEAGQLIRCEESKSWFDKITYTYRYDEAGNRTFAKKEKLYDYTKSWQNTYTYNDDNQMVEAKKREGNLTKSYTFNYDASGNLLKECFRNRAEVTYQYDTENRLTAVYDQQKLLAASIYDGDGERAFQLSYNPEAKCGYGKNVSGELFIPEHSTNEDGSLTAEGTLFGYINSRTGRTYELTEYVNDTNREYTEVLAEYRINAGVDHESYSYAGRMRISKNSFWNEARDLDCDQMSYYLYDGRGSVTANTWYNGMVIAVYQYDPYGQVTLGGEKYRDFYGYNAEMYSSNTGLQYLRARYYSAEQGRFQSEDLYLGEIRDPLSLNRYGYTNNSPLNYQDPSGHMPVNLLRTLSVLYDHNLLTDSEVSMATILFNGLGFFTAMHEIAQLNVAKDAFNKNHIADLEKRINEVKKKGKTKKCKSYEIDVIVDERYIWEIKSKGSSVQEAVKQINNYARIGGYQLGWRINIHDVPVFENIYMNIDSDTSYNAILRYSFYKKMEQNEKQLEEVTINEVREEYYKVYAVAVMPFVIIMGATFIEDITSMGIGAADDIVSLVAALGVSIGSVDKLILP